MIQFENDYNQGALPDILDKLSAINNNSYDGYGTDEICGSTTQLIRTLCNSHQLDVHFFTGGTQTNQTVISAGLRPYEGVIAADTGHINVHETGAVEAFGHKVLTISDTINGKLTAAQAARLYDSHCEDETHEHMVKPGMVYISHPTEVGTLYTKKELIDLSDACRARGLLLYVDGARLGYALASPCNDIFLTDLAALSDAFYIGGTKCGALFGEALVIGNDQLKHEFRYYLKQHGAMLAKGWLLGIQFWTLLEKGLYQRVCKEAVTKALKLRKALEEAGYPMEYDSHTNQQFPVLPDKLLDSLSTRYTYHFWKKKDNTHSVVRFCTSWATTQTEIDTLIKDICKQREGNYVC